MSYDLSLDNYEDMIFCCDEGEGIGPDEEVLLLEVPITTTGWDFLDLDISSDEVSPLLLLIDA